MPEPLRLLAFAAAACLVLFTWTWWFARRSDNATFVDVTWSLSFALVVPVMALLADGWSGRRVLGGAIVVLWSLRLGGHVARRTFAHRRQEDPRYTALREGRSNPWRYFLFIFWFQAALVVVLCTGFATAFSNGVSRFHPLELVAAAVVVLSVAGESIADRQLARFKSSAGTEGGVCDTGLWRYSRHPNYFFEWMVWVGFCLFALPSPWGWLAVTAPLIMLHFLLNVTGVAVSEEQSLRSKGAAYRGYQRRTPKFFPWFPRSA